MTQSVLHCRKQHLSARRRHDSGLTLTSGASARTFHGAIASREPGYRYRGYVVSDDGGQSSIRLDSRRGISMHEGEKVTRSNQGDESSVSSTFHREQMRPTTFPPCVSLNVTHNVNVEFGRSGNWSWWIGGEATTVRSFPRNHSTIR